MVNRRVMVLFQSSAYLTRLNPDDRVVSRGITRRPLKKFCSYRALFQGFVAAVQRMLHHVGQKLLAAVAGAEERAAQNGLELPEDSLLLGAIRGRAALVNLLVLVRYRGRLHRPRSFRCRRNCRASWGLHPLITRICFSELLRPNRPFPVQKLISTTDLYRVRVDPQEA